MATEAQTKANKLNAQKSTGPKTQEGKAVSSRNATTHGLSAKVVTLEGEDPREFQQLREQLLAEIHPETQVEKQLVEQLAGQLWRLRRIPQFEAAVTEWVAFREVKTCHQDRREVYPLMPSDKNIRGSNVSESNCYATGRTIEALILNGDLLAKLARHEAHLARQVKQTLEQLRQFQKAPVGETVVFLFDDDETQKQKETGVDHGHVGGNGLI